LGLDLYFSKDKRKYESLNIYIEPSDTKETIKEKMALAEKIKAKRILELSQKENGFKSNEINHLNFVEYFKKEMDKRNGNTKIVWKNCYKYLNTFANKGISIDLIDKKWLEQLIQYFQKKVGASSSAIYFSKIKTALNEAVSDGIITSNPAKLVKTIKVDDKNTSYLTFEEIQKVAKTYTSNVEVKKAFLFSCYTGLRVGDIMKLKWSNIVEDKHNDEKIFKVQIIQTKTKAVNYIPINATALKLIGMKQNGNALVFQLPSNRRKINRIIKKLLVDAQIEKPISFHSARHSCAVLLLANGADLYTVSKILGHKSIKSTQIYGKVIDASKNEAIKNLPQITI